jgi:hypothetical protein
MTRVVVWLYCVALAVWLGQTVFFSFIVAPRLFGYLPPEQAGVAVGLIFPAYYMAGHACGAIALVAALALRRWSRPGGVRWLIAALVCAVALAASLYAGIAIQPRASSLRQALHTAETAPAVRQEFDRLHARAVQLNAVVLGSTLLLSGLLATQIVEPSRRPRRRSRNEFDLQV